MTAYTAESDGKAYIKKEFLEAGSKGFEGAAAERLSALERLIADVEAEQERASAELKALREQGKEKTCKFRELMGNKLVNTSILSKLRAYHIV